MKFKPLLIGLCVITIASCKKDSVSNQTKTPEQLLTEKTWKADEVRIQISNNTTTYYKRGEIGNTVNFDSDSLKFNSNNTGVYYYLGSQYTTTWNFINADKSKMTIVINFTTPGTINLENVNLTENYFRYAQYASGGGNSYMASASRTPN
jgi:hypothetical protein